MPNNYLIESSDYLSSQNKIKEIIEKANFQDALISNYDCLNTIFADILEDLNTYGLFSNKKVIILTNFDTVIDEDLVKLNNYLDNYSRDNLLFLVTNKLDERKKIYKELKKKVTTITIDLNPVTFIKEELKNYKLEDGVINLINTYSLGDISKIHNECLKLKDYKVEEKAITKDDVEKLIVKKLGDSTDLTFSFSRALSLKDKKEALNLYNELLDYNIEPLSIIGLIASQLRIIYQVKCLKNKGLNTDKIAETLDVKPYRVTKTLELINYYSNEELLKLLEQLEEIDYKIKTTGEDPNSLIELFILNM